MYINKVLTIVSIAGTLMIPGLWGDTQDTSKNKSGSHSQHRGHWDRFDDDDSGLRPQPPGDYPKEVKQMQYDRSSSDDRWDDDDNRRRIREKGMDDQLPPGNP